MKKTINNQPQKGVLIAYGEMFLKSKRVKEIFQRQLISNLRFSLQKNEIKDYHLYCFRERIFLALGSEKERRGKEKKILKLIKKIFGISWFGEAFFFSSVQLGEIVGFIGSNYQNWIDESESFAIRLKLEKGFLRESREKVIEKIAHQIKRKVNLDNPDKEIFVEIRKNGAWIYLKKKKGAGGLPVGSSGKVLSLVSGGIDSPVSSYLMAKRGAKNIWVHFHSFPLVSSASIEKIRKLAEIFSNYQPNLKVYFVPFQDIQLEIKTKALPKYRVLLYRRAMLKIGEEIAKKEECQGLVTGESLGQVSSQTLNNLQITNQAVKMPIFRPLIGFDKEEIIKIAKKIKTFEISILPHEDCCTLFVSPHQTAKGNFEIIKSLEKEIGFKSLFKKAIKEAKIEKF